MCGSRNELMKFSKLATILEENHKKARKDKICLLLTDLFQKATISEAKVLAYLSTGRLGATCAVRIPWFDMKPEKLLSRLQQEGKIKSNTKGFDVNIVELYETLHQMDSFRPCWYPDNPTLADQLISLANRMDSGETKWLINLMIGRGLLTDRLIIKSIINSIGGEDAQVRDVVNRFNKCTPDIGLVAEYIIGEGIENGVRRLESIHYGIPVPVEEMNSQSLSQIDMALKRLRSQKKTIYLQAKSDGIYVQIQKDYDKVFVFDETGLDLFRLSEHKKERNVGKKEWISPSCIDYVVEVIKGINTPQVIFDAEIVGIDVIGNKVFGKIDTYKAKSFQIIVFDIIAGKTDLRQIYPYAERQREMYKLFGNKKPSYSPGIFVADEYLVAGLSEVSEKAENILHKNRYEGVILKNPNSKIEKSTTTKLLRWKFKRVKIKEYTTLDMLIVGYYLDKTGKYPSKYLLALRAVDSENIYPCVIAVAHKSIEDELHKYCNTTRSGIKPPNIIFNGKPDSWTDASMIVEIESDGLRVFNSDSDFAIRWTLHETGKRMILKIRKDKNRDRVNTIERLMSLQSGPGNFDHTHH